MHSTSLSWAIMGMATAMGITTTATIMATGTVMGTATATATRMEMLSMGMVPTLMEERVRPQSAQIRAACKK